MIDLTQADQFKQQVRASFDKTAPSYGTPGDFHWEFAKRLVERVPLHAGQVILDVATGTAPAAIMAAQRVGPQGQVLGIDISPGILEIAKQNIAAANLSNIRIEVGDAEQLTFPDCTFNGILCSSAIVWFPDIPRALREWYRLLHPGGWIAFSCFGGSARQTINNLVIQLLKPYGITYPELNTPLNTPTKCCQMVEQAGFIHTPVQIAQEQQLTTDADASFAQAWASGARFNINLAHADIVQIKTQYTTCFMELLHDQDTWNHDYEQFVVAYKKGWGEAR